jgi:hypothetical protein
LVTAGMRGISTFPTDVATDRFGGANASRVGVVFSLAAGIMDLVVGLDATTVFVQQLPNRDYLFRVVTRIAYRDMDTTGTVLLLFQ